MNQQSNQEGKMTYIVDDKGIILTKREIAETKKENETPREQK